MKIISGFSPDALKEKIRTAGYRTARLALSDCNRYCKVDSGELQKSSEAASDLNSGRLVWKTPYARAAYYLENARTEKNPEACAMWAHKAAARHSAEWLQYAETVLKGGG